ncbi:MAG: AraC family transcriptional regulator [Caldilinea sp. CFX5]|nr:AraC family transcriptional regulator [Caldilinea sp. CFX5]
MLAFDGRSSDSPYIETVWRSQSDCAGEFLSVAASHWEMVITQLAGNLHVTMRGPETQAKAAYCPADGEWLGVIFKLGAFMPNLPTVKLVDSEIDLPLAGEQSFWLHSAAWELPTYENVETFVARLVRAGLLAHEPLVDAALQNQATDLSRRSVQRRFLHATGLTHGAVSQIARARQATALLRQGVSILDTVALAGYADQPHLTRSLKRLVGQTPAQLLPSAQPKPMSLVPAIGAAEEALTR